MTPLELTAAYVPFANGGFRPEIHFVRKITDAKGRVLYENRGANAPRVVRPEIVGMMNSMMTGTISTGTARKAAFTWPSAGKTGTSQNSRDAWFIGYTANLTTGVWFGNDDGKPMKKVTGGSLPAQAWHEFMVAAHEGVPVKPLPGAWKPAPANAVAEGDGPATLAPAKKPVPPASVGQPVAAAPAPSRSQRSAQSADTGTGLAMPDDEAPTASIKRPVPPGDVGGPLKKKNTSILDILTGG